MFKFGIYKTEQLNKEKLEGFFGRRKFVALDLYDRLPLSAASEEQDYYQERMLNRLSVSNATFKYTHRNRFDDFDSKTVALIKERFETPERLAVHDIGVSDGRTSCPLYEMLNGEYAEKLHFLASDYAPYVRTVNIKGAKWRVIVDDANRCLQIILPPFVFNTIHPENKWLYPLNHVVRYIVTKFYVGPLLKKLNDCEGGNDIEERSVLLLCHSFQDLMKSNNNITFEQFDALSGPKGSFSVIRAMNLLNDSYFSKEQMKQIVQNIFNSLDDGGLFVTGSNLESGSAVNGNIYIKGDNGFTSLYEVGSGSPINTILHDIG